MAGNFVPERQPVLAKNPAFPGQMDPRWIDMHRRNAAATASVEGGDETTSTGSGSTDQIQVTGDGLRCNNASLLTLTGFVPPAPNSSLNYHIPIWSVGSADVEIVHENGSTDAARRFHTGAGVTLRLAAGRGAAIAEYDSISQRYRIVSHMQGAYLTPVYAAGSFTASSGTWTVAAGDVASLGYYLSGRSLTVQFSLTATSVSATPASLRIAIPGGYVAARAVRAATVELSDNGAAAAGVAAVAAAGTFISITRLDGAAFAAAADATAVHGELTFEVQG